MRHEVNVITTQWLHCWCLQGRAAARREHLQPEEVQEECQGQAVNCGKTNQHRELLRMVNKWLTVANQAVNCLESSIHGYGSSTMVHAGLEWLMMADDG